MNLHDEIMKLQRESYPHNLNREDILMAYRMGYRDARADAAKLAKETLYAAFLVKETHLNN